MRPSQPRRVSAPFTSLHMFFLLFLFVEVAACDTISTLWAIDNPANKISFSALGEGSFANVYRIQQGRTHFALKTSKHNHAANAQFENELRIMKVLQDNLSESEKQNFVLPSSAFKQPFNFHRLGENRSDRGIVMDYCNNGDLWTYIDKRSERSPLKHVRLALHVGRALLALKNVGVIHGDIKPENILLRRSESGEVVPALIDFGGSWIPRNNEVDTDIFTPGYKGPESSRSWGSDVFSFGTTIFSMFTGDLNYRKDSYKRLQQSNIRPGTPLHSLISDCLKPRARDRPTPEEIIKRLEKIEIDMQNAAKNPIVNRRQYRGTEASPANARRLKPQPNQVWVAKDNHRSRKVSILCDTRALLKSVRSKSRSRPIEKEIHNTSKAPQKQCDSSNKKSEPPKHSGMRNGRQKPINKREQSTSQDFESFLRNARAGLKRVNSKPKAGLNPKETHGTAKPPQQQIVSSSKKEVYQYSGELSGELQADTKRENDTRSLADDSDTVNSKHNSQQPSLDSEAESNIENMQDTKDVLDTSLNSEEPQAKLEQKDTKARTWESQDSLDANELNPDESEGTLIFPDEDVPGDATRLCTHFALLVSLLCTSLVF